MLYREIIAVCSEIHTKHTNTLCVQNIGLLNVKLVVHIVTTGLQRIKSQFDNPHASTISFRNPKVILTQGPFCATYFK